VIGFEQRFQQERQIAEQRLLRAQTPVVLQVHARTVLLERPDAEPLEVAARDDREPVRVPRLDLLEFPSNRVREPALRVEAHAPAEAARVRRAHFLDLEVDRRPPLRERQRIAQHVGHFAARAVNPPA
jgi:hypothetical protein